jgi:hypothetical protein
MMAKKKPQPVVCVVCETTFFSTMAGRVYNAPKFCSDHCFYIDYRRKHPERLKESRRKTHMKYREKDLANNKMWWRKNSKKLKKKRADYQKALPREKTSEYSRRYYKNNQVKERDRAYHYYYIGTEAPKGDLGWLKKAKTIVRNAQRQIVFGATPEACVSQRRKSEPEKTSPT